MEEMLVLLHLPSYWCLDKNLPGHLLLLFFSSKILCVCVLSSRGSI